jgi:hypothetical protein
VHADLIQEFGHNARMIGGDVVSFAGVGIQIERIRASIFFIAGRLESSGHRAWGNRKN